MQLGCHWLPPSLGVVAGLLSAVPMACFSKPEYEDQLVVAAGGVVQQVAGEQAGQLLLGTRRELAVLDGVRAASDERE